jgi:TolA-binding protein
MYMQDICRDTRRQVRELQEDQRQLRARVHELEEQLLSGPIQQQQTHHEHHHNDHDIVNTGDDEQDMDKQKNSGSYPRETTENRINGSAAIAAPVAPYPSPPMAASHTKRVSIDAAHPDTVDVDDADRNEPSSSPPTVIVTSAQQHRIVSSCLYMTDGEGLSDEDNDID